MKLDKNWRCCGQPPVCFKSLRIDVPKGQTPTLHYLCTWCNREYDLLGAQRENQFWKKNAAGAYRRVGKGA